MTYVSMGFLIILSLLLQMQFPGSAALAGAKMPFLMSVVIYFALRHGTGVMLVAGLCAGFLQDTSSNIPLGYSSLFFCLAGWMVSRFRSLVIMESIITPIFFGGIAGFFVTLCIYILIARDGLVHNSFGYLFIRMLGTGLFGMISTPLVFLLSSNIDQLLGNIEMKEDIDVLE